MLRVRQSVEWGFGKMKINFAFLDLKKNMKILLQPVAKYFMVGGFLINIHSCLYGSQTSSYLECASPTAEQDLA